MSASALASSHAAASRASMSVVVARLSLLAVIAAALALGFLLTGHDQSARAVARAGADLTRLLRAMAAIKAVVACGMAAAVFWRLGTAVTLPWLIAYAGACAAMAAGPVLIWLMAYVGTGTLLLHGGLLAALLLLWRDPSVAAQLSAMIALRRANLPPVNPLLK